MDATMTRGESEERKEKKRRAKKTWAIKFLWTRLAATVFHSFYGSVLCNRSANELLPDGAEYQENDWFIHFSGAG